MYLSTPSPEASAVVRSKVVALLIHFLLMVPLSVLFCVWSLFCCAALSVLSSFAIILVRERERERERTRERVCYFTSIDCLISCDKFICIEVRSALAHQIRISEILPWDRKSHLTHAILRHCYVNVTPSYEIAS